MKTKFFLILSCLCTGFLTAQTVPYWKLGGNPPAPGPVDAVGAGNNIFGTVGNFPLRTITNNTQRMHINQTLNYNINGQGNLPKDGFIGIGVAAGFYPNSGGQGPFSLLHLNGINAFGGPQQFGYRNWMQRV